MKTLTPIISIPVFVAAFLCCVLLADAQNAQMTEGPTYYPVPGPTTSCECKYAAKTCPSGQFMRGINEDGSLVCAKPSGGLSLSLGGSGNNNSTGTTSGGSCYTTQAAKSCQGHVCTCCTDCKKGYSGVCQRSATVNGKSYCQAKLCCPSSGNTGGLP